MKRKRVYSTKNVRSSRYLEETIRDTIYADNVVLLTNTTAQEELELHILE